MLNIKHLVTVEHAENGGVHFIFTDPSKPNFIYDPFVPSLLAGVELCAHISEKMWITKEHIRVYTWLLLDVYGRGE